MTLPARAEDDPPADGLDSFPDAVDLDHSVSVSIERYNIILVPVLAIAMAYALVDSLSRRFAALRVYSID